MNALHTEIKKHLSPGEAVLWSGQPRQGLVVRGGDALLIPFSLMWGGFAIFWEATVLRSNAPVFFVLWGIPFVLVGLHLIIGRFFLEAKQRSRTFYAVTPERILIVSGIFRSSAKSLNLRTLSDLSLTEGKNNEGTIAFGGGSGSLFTSMFGGLGSWPGVGTYMGPRFELIANAKSVFKTIRDAQRAT